MRFPGVQVVGRQTECNPHTATSGQLNAKSIHRPTMARDESHQSFRPVPETDAWSDDDGNAHYILDVERIDNGT